MSLSSTKFVFLGLIGKTRCPPWPLIGLDIFNFSSETAEQNSTKLDRKQDLNLLYQLYVFRAYRKKNKMAAPVSHSLRHFQLFLWNCWTEFNKFGSHTFTYMYMTLYVSQTTQAILWMLPFWCLTLSMFFASVNYRHQDHYVWNKVTTCVHSLYKGRWGEVCVSIVIESSAIFQIEIYQSRVGWINKSHPRLIYFSGTQSWHLIIFLAPASIFIYVWNSLTYFGTKSLRKLLRCKPKIWH